MDRKDVLKELDATVKLVIDECSKVDVKVTSAEAESIICQSLVDVLRSSKDVTKKLISECNQLLELMSKKETDKISMYDDESRNP